MGGLERRGETGVDTGMEEQGINYDMGLCVEEWREDTGEGEGERGLMVGHDTRMNLMERRE